MLINPPPILKPSSDGKGVILEVAGWPAFFVSDEYVGVLAAALKARDREVRRLRRKIKKEIL